MTSLREPPTPAHPSRLVLTGNSALRLFSVGLRALMTLAMAVWLQPSELGVYAIVAATLTLTTYLYGLDFQSFSMRELSSTDLAGARRRVRDQFALLVVIYALGSGVLALVLTQFGVEPKLIALVVPMAVLQHATLEFYRIFTRLGRPIAGTIVLLIRDAAWVPLCMLAKLVTGQLTLTTLLVFWLLGCLAGALFGAILIVHWLPPSKRSPVDLAWLASGLRTGLRMLAGTLSVVALFTVDRMIFGAIASSEQMGAYALFALGCASVQGLFETAILPAYWAPLLQAKKENDAAAYGRAERHLTRACLIAGFVVGPLSAAALTVLAWLLPHRAYAENLHLLYYIAAAYSLLAMSNIPHYRLFAARLDSRIVTVNVTAFIAFLVLSALLVRIDRAIAVPLALALACATLLVGKGLMVRQARAAAAS